jgi:uncharacterized protein YihD (DUF1040 family)
MKLKVKAFADYLMHEQGFELVQTILDKLEPYNQDDTISFDLEITNIKKEYEEDFREVLIEDGQ